MDSARFDALTKLTAARATRRGVGLFALLGLGAALPSAGEAKKPKCKKNQQPCKDRCIPKNKCCTAADCPRGEGFVCRKGACKCSPDRKACGPDRSQCFPRNAQCCQNTDCRQNEFCFGGICGCVPGAKLCGNSCILNEQCCSDPDCTIPDQVCNGNRVCACRSGTRPCKGGCIPDTAGSCCTNADCPATDLCEGNQCIVGAGTCPSGTDICTNSGLLVTCNPTSGLTCICVLDRQGRTRCALTPDNSPPCNADADCTAFFQNPRAFCPPAGPDCNPLVCMFACNPEIPD